jgi:hypothetical protein
VLLQHREEADALFGLVVGIDNRFFNQRREPPRREPCPPAALLLVGWRHDWYELRRDVATEGVDPAFGRELGNQALRDTYYRGLVYVIYGKRKRRTTDTVI